MNERIKQVRKHEELTQTEFADALGLSMFFVSSIETGKKNAGEKTIKQICRTFGVSEHWLRTGEGPMYDENTKTAHLYEWAVRTLSDGDPFKVKLFEAMSRLSPDQWEAVKRFARSLIEDEEQ